MVSNWDSWRQEHETLEAYKEAVAARLTGRSKASVTAHNTASATASATMKREDAERAADRPQTSAEQHAARIKEALGGGGATSARMGSSTVTNPTKKDFKRAAPVKGEKDAADSMRTRIRMASYNRGKNGTTVEDEVAARTPRTEVAVNPHDGRPAASVKAHDTASATAKKTSAEKHAERVSTAPAEVPEVATRAPKTAVLNTQNTHKALEGAGLRRADKQTITRDVHGNILQRAGGTGEGRYNLSRGLGSSIDVEVKGRRDTPQDMARHDANIAKAKTAAEAKGWTVKDSNRGYPGLLHLSPSETAPVERSAESSADKIKTQLYGGYRDQADQLSARAVTTDEHQAAMHAHNAAVQLSSTPEQKAYHTARAAEHNTAAKGDVLRTGNETTATSPRELKAKTAARTPEQEAKARQHYENVVSPRAKQASLYATSSSDHEEAAALQRRAAVTAPTEDLRAKHMARAEAHDESAASQKTKEAADKQQKADRLAAEKAKAATWKANSDAVRERLAARRETAATAERAAKESSPKRLSPDDRATYDRAVSDAHTAAVKARRTKLPTDYAKSAEAQKTAARLSSNPLTAGHYERLAAEHRSLSNAAPAEVKAKIEPMRGSEAHAAMIKSASNPSAAEKTAAERYVGDASAINMHLRDGGSLDDKVRSFDGDEMDGRQLSNLVKKSKLPKDTELWRGTNDASEIFGPVGSRVGHDFVDPGFVSTDVHQSKAKEFANNDEDTALIRIVAPKGTPGLAVSKYIKYSTDEREILLDAGSTFRVTSDKVVGRDRLVELQVVQEETAATARRAAQETKKG